MTIIKTETVSLLKDEKEAFNLVDVVLENITRYASNPELIQTANDLQAKLEEFESFWVEEE